jgi:hypothetical protein
VLALSLGAFSNAVLGESERERQRQVALVVLADRVLDATELAARDAIEDHALLGFEVTFRAAARC